MLAHFFDPYVKESLKRVHRQALVGVARKGKKGKKLTQATKDKMSDQRKGRKLTQATKDKISEKGKGRKLTQASRDKISEKAKEREERKRREVTQ